MSDTKLYPDTATEDAYWRDNFRTRPYVTAEDRYEDFGPAYAYGVDTFGRREGRHFDQAESELSRDWEKFKGKSKLTWERAKAAVRDAWDRMTD